MPESPFSHLLTHLRPPPWGGGAGETGAALGKSLGSIDWLCIHSLTRSSQAVTECLVYTGLSAGD